jgi:ABC-type dipeptide/oligopeptide/nickel transport system permease component
LTRFVRASILDFIHQDFVTTARAKGLTERRTILWHVVRNALIPVITIVALQSPGIFTGAVITEQIFRVPGIGSLLSTAIQSTDTPVGHGDHLCLYHAGGGVEPRGRHHLWLPRSPYYLQLRERR